MNKDPYGRTEAQIADQREMEAAREKCSWAVQTGERNAFLEGWDAGKESAAAELGAMALKLERETSALNARLERAEGALTRAGFTYLDGAQEWKPPKGKAPRFIDCGLTDEVRSVLRMFMSLYVAKGWEGDLVYERAEALIAGCPTTKSL